MKCKNCKKNSLKRIVKIGKQPLSGFFYLRKETNLPKYSLDLYKCSNCSLVQLNNSSDTKKMYGSHYGYKTSVSKMMVSHLREKIKRLKKYKIIKKGNNLLDIGSNDASFLKLLGKNCNLYGVDPSAKKFKKEYKGMKLITDFFSKKNILKNIKNENIKFDLISSFAMFYDVEDPNSFCQDIEMLLSDNGIWVCEFSYLPLMLKNLTFDQICHEHVMYYAFGVFEKILLNNNLKVTNIKLNEITCNLSFILVNLEIIDVKNLFFPLKLRIWKEGDKIIPLGMKGSKKVSDILIDTKTSMLEKQNQYVLENGNGKLIWVIVKKISDEFKITKLTQTKVKLGFNPLP